MPINVGDPAPTFALFDTGRQRRRLEDFESSNLVLAFFPGAFTSVCTKELCTFQESLARLGKLNAQVVAISVDAPAANKAFAAAHGVEFPILSDYARSAVHSYDVVHEDFAGLPGYVAAKRSVFVLDRSRRVRFHWVADHPGLEPPYEEIDRILGSMAQEEMKK